MEKGSSGSAGADSINGLKFGKKIYFAGSGSGLRPEEAPTSPAKKGRAAVVQGGQAPQCQVEGCKADLSDAKAYYCRHKVCGVHSKSPRVIVAGLEQRFCQQCSRFHQLPEFDQGKRSCRRRLAGHNERRRKPPPAPLLPPSTYDNHSRGGGFVMDFSSYSSNVTGIDSWANMSTERGLGNQSPIPPKYHPSWPTISHNPLPNLLQSPNPPQEGCFNPSALSLLSNTSWAGSKALDLGTSDFLGPVGSSVTVGQFPWGPWGFTGNQVSGPLHDIPPDMGIAAFSESSSTQFNGVTQSSNEHYQDEIEQSPDRAMSVHQMHWSL